MQYFNSLQKCRKYVRAIESYLESGTVLDYTHALGFRIKKLRVESHLDVAQSPEKSQKMALARNALQRVTLRPYV